MAVSLATKKWTLAELHRLPDDHNKYELVRGELFVTPAPSPDHETIAVLLTKILLPFVEKHALGEIYRPKAVVRLRGSEVEPDLFVARRYRGRAWAKAPRPILVVEIISPFSGMRDRHHKRKLYMDAGIAEYWIVDPEDRSITCVRREMADVFVTRELTWHPSGVRETLTFDVRQLFADD